MAGGCGGRGLIGVVVVGGGHKDGCGSGIDLKHFGSGDVKGNSSRDSGCGPPSHLVPSSRLLHPSSRADAPGSQQPAASSQPPAPSPSSRLPAAAPSPSPALRPLVAATIGAAAVRSLAGAHSAAPALPRPLLAPCPEIRIE